MTKLRRVFDRDVTQMDMRYDDHKFLAIWLTSGIVEIFVFNNEEEPLRDEAFAADSQFCEVTFFGEYHIFPSNLIRVVRLMDVVIIPEGTTINYHVR